MRLHLRTTAIVAILFIASLSLYLYMTIHGQLLLLRLNQTIRTYQRAQDWDWQPTSEEIFCRSAHGSTTKEPIPALVHFVLLAKEGERVELSYAQFLSIKAAVLRMNASEVKIHTFGLDTENEWWREIQDRVTLVHVDRNTVVPPRGIELSSLALAHQSDLIRLEILAREGGIYVDMDVYALKSFADLLTNPRDTVMGHEGANRYGLCNAVIVTRAESEFMRLWRDSYATFDPRNWNGHSVFKPKELQVAHPGLACPLAPTVFFWPFWEEWNVRYMHELIDGDDVAELQTNMTTNEGSMYPDQLAYHSWGGHAYLRNLTPQSIVESDTRFNLLMRDVALAPL